MENLYIKLKENIDINDYADIDNLKSKCFDYDKINLKLENDFKLKCASENSENMNLINEFMLYDGENLVGYIGICSFGGNALEVNGMVHPEYRRRGIFTRLFSLIIDEFNKRDIDEILLLSDNNSTGGIEFIKKVSSDYDHSEYDMNLDMNVLQELKFDNIVFRKATIEDVNKISRDNFEFFYESDLEGISDDEKNNSLNCTYVMAIGNEIIGKTRLEINDHVGGIYGLEILPDYRGKGYGRELLIHSIIKLKERNVDVITLQVETNNKNALYLYKSCGFKENYIMDYYSLKK